MPVIKFTKEKVEIEVPQGANLRAEAVKAGVNVHQGVNGFGAGLNKSLIGNCHGFGVCATCQVLITKGMENVTSTTIREKVHNIVPFPNPIPALTKLNEENMRLSCQVKVNGDIEVETGPELDLFGENFFS